MARSGTTNKEIFTTIFHTNHWNSEESLSGPGAEMRQTREVRKALPKIFKQFSIRSLLDIGCGDFNWMKIVDLSELDRYIGVDIVNELITLNTTRYVNEKKKFIELDVVNNPLPRADLVFCRNCFVHLSNDDIYMALNNIKKSRSTFLLTTTYIREKANTDTKQGKWRPINFNIKPFNFPPFIEYINTDFGDGEKNHPGNGMAFWRVSDLPVS